MKRKQKTLSTEWYKAALTPAAIGLFTEAFYPTENKNGVQYVFFTQIDVTPTTHKVIVASRLEESGLRMMTQDLAAKCLIPGKKATKAEIEQLNILSSTLKV
jgi:hypothetical protein